MHKKGLKFAPVVELLALNSTKTVKAGPGFDDRPEHPSVQVNSSSPCGGQLACESRVLYPTCSHVIYT